MNMENYFTIIPREILLLIVDYLNSDDIDFVDRLVSLTSNDWKILISNKNKHIDVDKVIHIDWNYIDVEGEYYKSIYLKLNYALSDALYVLNPIYNNHVPSLVFPINKIFNVSLLLILDDQTWNKQISQFFSGADFYGGKNLNILKKNPYMISIIGSKIERRVSERYVVNILTQVFYNSGSISEQY